MTIEAQGANVVIDWDAEIQAIVCKCDKQVKANKQSTCRQLGHDKHDCCDKEIQKKKNKTGPGRQEQLAPERGYTNPSNPPVSRIKMTRLQSWISRQNRGSAWPDAMLLDQSGSPKQLIEFKFKCPAGVKTSRPKKTGIWGRCSGNQANPTWTRYKGGRTQRDKYTALSRALGIDPNENPPNLKSNVDC